MPKKGNNESKKKIFAPGIIDTGIAARRVVTRSPRRSVGISACSWIQNVGIEYESELERRFLQRALIFPSLQRIIHQPFKIAYLEQGKELFYTPDFLLILGNGSKVVVEVKPEVFVKKHLTKLNAAEQILGNEHIPFLVLTDKKIDADFAAINAALLLRYARGSITEADKHRCIELLRAEVAPIPVGLLMEKAAVLLGDIYHLAARGEISIQLELEITDETLVTLLNKENENGFICFCNWFNTTPGRTIAGISAAT